MKYEIVAIGDKSTCDACNSENGKRYDEEDLPEMSEVCEGGDNCRCAAVPVDLMDDPEIQKALEDVAEKMMDGVITDQTTGKRIILKYFEGVEGLGNLTYETLATYEDLIVRYTTEVGTLPAEWYALKNINKQIEWLEMELE